MAFFQATFHKARAAMDKEGSGRSGQPSRKGLTVLDALKNICDSWEKVKMSMLTGDWKNCYG